MAGCELGEKIAYYVNIHGSLRYLFLHCSSKFTKTLGYSQIFIAGGNRLWNNTKH